MVSLYKGLMAIYFGVAALCMVGGYVYLTHYPNGLLEYLIVMILILGATITILHRAALNRFAREVTSLFNNCFVNAYIQALTDSIGKKHSKSFRSSYACLTAQAYEALGDYDSLYASCQNITLRSHMPIFHRRMFSYYLNRKEMEFAKDQITALNALSASAKNRAGKILIDNFIKECENAYQVRLGNYDDAEKNYTEMLNKEGDIPLITRVSYAFALGQVLVLKGKKDEAKTHLLFVSSRGGDTIYKKDADKLLSNK